MKNAIIVLVPDSKFYLETRGMKMTLSLENNFQGKWMMHVDNASSRAYRGLGIKFFKSLKDVEKNYKSWKGINSLVEENKNDYSIN